eukprot:PhF_6_TR6889/c0_g1_i2/m.9966
MDSSVYTEENNDDEHTSNPAGIGSDDPQVLTLTENCHVCEFYETLSVYVRYVKSQVDAMNWTWNPYQRATVVFETDKQEPWLRVFKSSSIKLGELPIWEFPVKDIEQVEEDTLPKKRALWFMEKGSREYRWGRILLNIVLNTKSVISLCFPTFQRRELWYGWITQLVALRNKQDLILEDDSLNVVRSKQTARIVAAGTRGEDLAAAIQDFTDAFLAGKAMRKLKGQSKFACPLENTPIHISRGNARKKWLRSMDSMKDKKGRVKLIFYRAVKSFRFFPIIIDLQNKETIVSLSSDRARFITISGIVNAQGDIEKAPLHLHFLSDEQKRAVLAWLVSLKEMAGYPQSHEETYPFVANMIMSVRDRALTPHAVSATMNRGIPNFMLHDANEANNTGGSPAVNTMFGGGDLGDAANDMDDGNTHHTPQRRRESWGRSRLNQTRNHHFWCMRTSTTLWHTLCTAPLCTYSFTMRTTTNDAGLQLRNTIPVRCW